MRAGDQNSEMPKDSAYISMIQETAARAKEISRNAVREAMDDGASVEEAAQKAFEALNDDAAPSPVPNIDPGDDDVI